MSGSISYSHMMLIEPASKVGTPVWVVIRIRSSVADKVFDDANVVPLGAAEYVAPEAAQVFPLSKHIVATPEKRSPAVVGLYTQIPSVVETVERTEDAKAVCPPA